MTKQDIQIIESLDKELILYFIKTYIAPKKVDFKNKELNQLYEEGEKESADPNDYCDVLTCTKMKQKNYYYCLDHLMDSNPWIEWKGGECPVDGDVEVQVECWSNKKQTRSARDFRWSKSEDTDDIIAYRVVQ